MPVRSSRLATLALLAALAVGVPAQIRAAAQAPASADAQEPGGRDGAPADAPFGPPPLPPADDAAFDALITRLRAGDTAVDFTRLRRLYAAGARYRPVADEREAQMTAAYVGGDAAGALTLARTLLDDDYMNLEAHSVAALACNRLQDAACVDRHSAMMRGVLGSIQSSGNGRSTRTAYVVVSPREEYALVRVMGLRVVSQALIHDRDGHAYDLLTLQDSRTPPRDLRLYFNIDQALTARARASERTAAR